MLNVLDPMKLKDLLWPNVKFYREQREMIYSVWNNDETVVPAGNKLGKDYTAGFIILAFFLTRHPCRIVTTSAKDDHLRVLWGEIGNFLETSEVPLDVKRGGPLVVNHREIKKVVNGRECKLSYLKGMVAAPDSIAAMQGHHIAKTGDGVPRTLFVADECSSVPDDYYKMAKTWMNRFLAIGNTWPCDNFFKHAIKGKPGTDDRGGDIPRTNGRGYFRKVIKIRAVDSPNVRLALAQKASGREPTGEMLVHGVKDWEDYSKEVVLWDEVQKCVSHDAEFWEGADVLMYPRAWIDRAHRRHLELAGRPRQAKAIGVDPAEGGDDSSWTVVDQYGVIEQVSFKTPDTSVVPDKTIELMHRYNIPASMVIFDRGGGGQQHADAMRKMGHKVRTVAFGESLSLDPKRGINILDVRIEIKEDRYVYFNRRAQMYHDLRLALDPEGDPITSTRETFAIPSSMGELRRQMEPIPLKYDGEGRIKMLPKNKREQDSDEPCLTDLIGCSPDELDSLVLALHGVLHKKRVPVVG